ncbi:hypothetical protein FHS26_006850 [Rhizobium pisi]|uniref:Uncharacterized protein n=1 Tax=Rhizobium pisi TaxID=574561 RepID=A0A7W5G3G7_9HYPH|nr:hypothetical protein [Rhizobium pisi]
MEDRQGAFVRYVKEDNAGGTSWKRFAKGLMNLPELGLYELVAPCIVGSGKPVDDSFDDCPCISPVVRAGRGAISHNSKKFAVSPRDPRMIAIVVGARSFLA